MLTLIFKNSDTTNFKPSQFQIKAINVFYMYRNKKLNFMLLIKFLNRVLQDFDIFISLGFKFLIWENI